MAEQQNIPDTNTHEGLGAVSADQVKQMEQIVSDTDHPYTDPITGKPNEDPLRWVSDSLVFEIRVFPLVFVVGLLGAVDCELLALRRILLGFLGGIAHTHLVFRNVLIRLASSICAPIPNAT